jgi:hypothetical protein
VHFLDLEFLAAGFEPYRYPLATGPERVTLEGRKMAMAGKATAPLLGKEISHWLTNHSMTGIFSKFKKEG